MFLQTLHVLRWSMDGMLHIGMYKGGAQSEIPAGTQGEYGQQMEIKKRISWSALCP